MSDDLAPEPSPAAPEWRDRWPILFWSALLAVLPVLSWLLAAMALGLAFAYAALGAVMI